MTPELLSFVSFSAGVFISCTVFVFVLRGRNRAKRVTDAWIMVLAARLAQLEDGLPSEDRLFNITIKSRKSE